MTLSREHFDELYRRHAPGSFRRARRLLGSDADAHEVVHDVFLSLWERPGQFAANSSMSTFLYAAVTHACLNRIRNHNTRTRLSLQHFTQAPTLSVAPIAQPDQTSVLRSALERLPHELAQVAVYYYFDELTHRDIASILGCSHRHVGALLERLEHWVKAEEREPCVS